MKNILFILILSFMSYGQEVKDDINLYGNIEVVKKTKTTKKVVTLNKKVFNYCTYIYDINNNKVEILFDRKVFLEKINLILKKRNPQLQSYIELRGFSKDITSKDYIYPSMIIKSSSVEYVFLSIMKDLILSSNVEILFDKERIEKIIFFEKNESYDEIMSENQFENHTSYYEYFIFKTLNDDEILSQMVDIME